jgi:hypothetical protein
MTKRMVASNLTHQTRGLRMRRFRARPPVPAWMPLTALLVGSSGSVASAATIEWANAVTGDWDVAVNWNPAQVPGAGDDVLIDQTGSYVVRVTSDASAGSVSIGAPASSITLRVLYRFEAAGFRATGRVTRMR